MHTGKIILHKASYQDIALTFDFKISRADIEFTVSSFYFDIILIRLYLVKLQLLMSIIRLKEFLHDPRLAHHLIYLVMKCQVVSSDSLHHHQNAPE